MEQNNAAVSTRKMKNLRLISLAGCALMGIGVFFPFTTIEVSMFGEGMSVAPAFIEGDGLIVLVTAIAAGALVLARKRLIALVPIVIGLLVTVFDMSDIAGEFDEGPFSASAQLGVSPWLILAGGLAAAVAILVGLLGAKADD